MMEQAGYKVEIAMTMTEVLDILLAEQKITATQHDEMIAFMRQS